MPDEQEEWAKARKATYDAASPAMVKFLRDAMRAAIRKHGVDDHALYTLGEDISPTYHPGDWPDDADLFIAEVAIAIQGAASA